MGGESSSGSDSSMTNEQLNRAKRNREQKEREQSRQKAFEVYEQYPGDMLQTDQRVLDNIKLATDLENRARKSEINIPIPTMGTVAMNTISSINYGNQAKQLRAGGKAVYDEQGTYRGVVGSDLTGLGKGYWGDADYDPIGRSQGVEYNTKTGTYTTSQIQQQDSGSETTNNTPSNTQTTAINKTDSTTTLSTASRRALISSGGGSALRRNLI